MALAQAVNMNLLYVAETTAGTTPAAALTFLRNTSSSLNVNIATTTSQEIVSTGDTTDLVRTAGTTGGDIGMEYSFAEYRPFVESAVRGTFSTAVTLTATDISVNATDQSLNSVAGGFSTTNFLAGHWVRVTGYTTNTAAFIGKIVSVTPTKMVLSHFTLSTEAAGASITVKGRSVRNGTTKKFFTIEERYTDLSNTFQVYKGQHVNKMTIDAASESIIKGTFGFMGMTGAFATATAGTGSDVAASANPLMSATANVGTVFIDGTAVSGVYFKNINLSVDGNNRSLSAISNLYPIGINIGTISAKFAVTAFFNDTTLLAKFLAGTSFALAYSFSDSSGNYVVVDAPYCKFDTGTLDGKTLNADVMQNLSITALKSPSLGYTLQISELG